MILNALRLIVGPMGAFKLEEGVLFWLRTRKTVSMATSVLPCREDDSARIKGEIKFAHSTGWSFSP